jgi:hypothetical protein
MLSPDLFGRDKVSISSLPLGNDKTGVDNKAEFFSELQNRARKSLGNNSG